MHNLSQSSTMAKCTLNLSNENTETATTKFVIVVTILGIIFFIALYSIIILKSNSHLNEPSENLRNDSVLNSRNSESNGSKSGSEISENPSRAESLGGKSPPQPFINNLRGPSPASFHPTRPKSTAVTYAQLQNYNSGPPHNIQDIIGFLVPNDRYKKQMQSGLKPYLSTQSHDPFHSYKPKDPSDINLLATANLRFAPPVWKEIQQKPATQSSTMQAQESSVFEQQATKNKRGLTLTLNVFPMANDPRKENFYAISSKRMPSIVNNKMQQPRKMIIHLNLFQSENTISRLEEGDQDYEMEKDLIERSNQGLQQVLNKNIKT